MLLLWLGCLDKGTFSASLIGCTTRQQMGTPGTMLVRGRRGEDGYGSRRGPREGRDLNVIRAPQMQMELAQERDADA